MTNEKGSPPKWPRKLLLLFCSSSVLEEVDGDLIEEYHYQWKTYGPRKAYWDYIINVITFILQFSTKREKDHKTSLLISAMWKNYLTTAVRNFARNRT